MNIKPLGDRIIVKSDPIEKITKSGIYIPPNAQETPMQGTIVSIGDGIYNTDLKAKIRLSVKVGDRILYGKYNGTEIEYDGETYLIMRESDIYCIIW